MRLQKFLPSVNLFGFYWHDVIYSRCTSQVPLLVVLILFTYEHIPCNSRFARTRRWLRRSLFSNFKNTDGGTLRRWHLAHVLAPTFGLFRTLVERSKGRPELMKWDRFVSLRWRQLLLRSRRVLLWTEELQQRQQQQQRRWSSSSSSKHISCCSQRTRTHGAKPGCVAISTYTTAPDASGCGRRRPTLKNEFQLGMGVSEEGDEEGGGGGQKGGTPPDSAWVRSTHSHSLPISCQHTHKRTHLYNPSLLMCQLPT